MLGTERRRWILSSGVGAVAVSVAVVFLLVVPGAVGASVTTASALARSSKITHCSVAKNPGYPAYDPVNGYVYVPTSSGTVDIVKAPCKSFASITFLSGSNLAYAAFDPQDNYVYVTDFGLNQVYVLSGTGIVTTINGGWFDAPRGIVYDPSAAGMLVANSGSDNVTGILGTQAYSLLSLPGSPEEISIDPVYGSIDVTLPESNEFITAGPNDPLYAPPTTVYTWSTGTGVPVEIAYDPAIPATFVGNMYTNNLTVLYSASAGLASVNVGTEPEGICYSTDSQYMFVLNTGSNSVSEVNSALHVAKTVKLGSGVGPLGCAYDDATGQMYVTGTYSDELYVVP
jgi:DNA-binding beta-propeller fold protein YncE